jgi:hypothetical protein
MRERDVEAATRALIGAHQREDVRPQRGAAE